MQSKTTNLQKAATFWGFLSFAADQTVRLGAALISVQPFAYVAGNYTRQYENNECDEKFQCNHPLPAGKSRQRKVFYHNSTVVA